MEQKHEADAIMAESDMSKRIEGYPNDPPQKRGAPF
jgi:hypothetical protein